MDVFISWSGERSKCLAEALRNWIPKIVNAVKPWLSSADIDKGARWSTDVASKLEASKVGIICLTPGNVHSDWILFEAGALSKTLQNTLVCPLLAGLEPADIQGPLAQFQATRATKDEIKKLVITINSALGDKALADAHLDEAFEVWWPKLEAQIKTLPADEGAAKPQRQEREILEEILALVRSEARAGARFEGRAKRNLERGPNDDLLEALLGASADAGMRLHSCTLSDDNRIAVLQVRTDKGEREIRLARRGESEALLRRRIYNRLRKSYELLDPKPSTPAE